MGLWYLTLKAPITTAADDKFSDIFPNFRKNKEWYFKRIVCQQTILMKYHEHSIENTSIYISGSICDYPHLQLTEKS